MEISSFLHKPSAINLRNKFLSGEQEKRTLLFSFLNDLEKNNYTPSVHNLEKVNNIFHAAHRLKGSGGTYGFSEISLVYFDLLKYARPPFNEKRMYDAQEAQNLKHILNAWHSYYPKYLETYQNILNNKNPHGALFISSDREWIFNSLIETAMINNEILFSSSNFEDTLLALDTINPSLCMIEINDHTENVLNHIKKLKNTKKVTFTVAFWKTNHNPEEKQSIIQSFENEIKNIEGVKFQGNKNVRFI